MNLLATLRHQQQTRARTVLVLLVVVWLNLALQACTAAAPANDMPADRTAVTNPLDLNRAHSDHTQPEQCPFCPDCEDDGCAEQGPCDGPVVAGTKAEYRPPDSSEFPPVAAAGGYDLEVVFISGITSPNRTGSTSVTAAAVSLNIQYCVYLI